MKDNKIAVTRSSMPPFEEYCQEIKELWDSHWLTNMGVKHSELENQLTKYLNASNITLYTNGHLALEHCLSALSLKGEVITTPFTFASTTNAIVRQNLKPVFVDVKEDDFTLDPSLIEKKITKNTSAIIPVHVYGNVCDYKSIENIAKKHGLKVIYDAAHAFGEKINGESVANLGDVSMFSFHSTKVFNTIEGGALCYSDKKLKYLLDCYKNFGMDKNGDYVCVGGNAKMNEFQAAMGICNLRHLDEEIAKRKKVYERYFNRLNGYKGIILGLAQQDVEYNYAYFPVVFSNYKLSRNEIFERLAEQDIYGRKYFYPLTSSFTCFKGTNLFSFDSTPIAKRISENVLCLPMYADLKIEDVDRICDLILNV